MRGSGFRETLYVPKRWLRAKEWVVIVDDVIRTGETQKALVELVRRARAKVAGLFAIISVGDWRGKVDVDDDCVVDILVTLNEQPASASR